MTLIINTFLIGVQKAGTTTFWNWLEQHPEIYGPEVMKDYHFFTRQSWWEKGVNHLHKFYKSYQNEPIIMHGGVNYYFEPEFIERVLEYQPEGKYIIILRDPIERAWSAFHYFTKLRQEKRTFEQAVGDELNGRNHPRDRHMYAYLEHGLYAKYLKILLQKISPDRLMILHYEELFKKPELHLKKVFEFLLVDPEFQVNTTRLKNKTGQVRFAWLNEMLFSKSGMVGFLKRYLPLQKMVPLSWRIQLGNKVRDVNIKQDMVKPELSNEVRDFLESYFKEDQKELRVLLELHFQTSSAVGQ